MNSSVKSLVPSVRAPPDDDEDDDDDDEPEPLPAAELDDELELEPQAAISRTVSRPARARASPGVFLAPFGRLIGCLIVCEPPRWLASVSHLPACIYDSVRSWPAAEPSQRSRGDGVLQEREQRVD